LNHGVTFLAAQSAYVCQNGGSHLKAIDRTLSRILHSGDQYVIPAFQRYYSWGKENWDKLWDDVVELYADESTKAHFMGSIVCMPGDHMPGVVPAYLVIDGQQRLVTLSLLLSALRDLSTDSKSTELAEEIQESFLVHKYKIGLERYKVFTRLRDRDAFAAIMEKNPPSEATRSTSIESAYRYYRERIAQGSEDGQSFDLRKLFVTVADRLDFVLITLEGDSPFKIFKSLNSTGVPLQESDLIRNYVFMQVALDRMDGFDDEHWRPLEKMFEERGSINSGLLSGFLRDFLISHGTYIRKDETADAFEKTFPPKTFDPVSLAKDLKRFARHHSIALGRTSHVVPEVENSIRGLRELDVGTSSPLVLVLLEARDSKGLPNGDLTKAIESIRGFVLRRYVCGESSRAYGRWFAAACKEFSSGGVVKLAEFLKKRGWPNDARFEEALIRFSLYFSEYGHALLKALEQGIPTKEPVSLANVQIEHVMPQTLSKEWTEMLGPEHETIHETWKDTLGNLTLTGYNPELSNRPFEEKKKVYESSGIQLNRYFREKERWSESDITERGRDLAKKAARIFPGPP